MTINEKSLSDALYLVGSIIAQIWWKLFIAPFRVYEKEKQQSLLRVDISFFTQK